MALLKAALCASARITRRVRLLFKRSWSGKRGRSPSGGQRHEGRNEEEVRRLVDELESTVASVDRRELGNDGTRSRLADRLRQTANTIHSRRDRQKRGEDELREACWHLGYEVDMFFSLANRLRWGLITGCLEAGTFKTAACLEAMLVHARILHEFLYFPRPHRDTLHASDYVDDWESIRPDEPVEFKDARKLRTEEVCDAEANLRDYINKEIVHLTYTRRHPVAAWDFAKLARLMWRRVEAFARAVPRTLVDEKLLQEVHKHQHGFWTHPA